MLVTLSIRTTALAVGAAAAGVGMYAAYEAAARADGGYLMVAAPIVALAAALLPAYAEVAWRARQRLKALVLLAVWLPCASSVFFVASERFHAAKALGEAQRAASHSVADRAAADLADARTASKAATAAADKVRGRDAKACKAACLSVKASETAAQDRLAKAEAALAAAQGKAVTEASLKGQFYI